MSPFNDVIMFIGKTQFFIVKILDKNQCDIAAPYFTLCCDYLSNFVIIPVTVNQSENYDEINQINFVSTKM